MPPPRATDKPQPPAGPTLGRFHAPPPLTMPTHDSPYVSRAGLKLAAALDQFNLHVTGWTCADFGCNVGGFTDCLLQRGAARLYAVDTGYGTLAYSLRKDPRVVVMERTNAMHLRLPEPVDLVTIDVGWTPQRHILPAAAAVLAPAGQIVSLIKPHYEADKRSLRDGVLDPEAARTVCHAVLDHLRAAGFEIRSIIDSPITGHAGNREFLALIAPPADPPAPPPGRLP
jgi:23S rRNA (cytidine1920-2'-O)/16S rRNA (cytidine1409-2'-O)-methyltransferase